jgi:hypothetical protein
VHQRQLQGLAQRHRLYENGFIADSHSGDNMPNRQSLSSRRSFFAGAATVGAAAAAVVAIPPVATPVAAEPEAVRQPPEKGGGYHLSAHVKHYYKTTQL